MTARLFLLFPMLLGACTLEGMSTDPTAPSLDKAGTCFALVTAEKDGSYTLMTGIADGSKAPVGVPKAGLDAAAVDKAFARERAIMDINPECLAIYAKGREAAQPGA